jgi:hypothetical protein
MNNKQEPTEPLPPATGSAKLADRWRERAKYLIQLRADQSDLGLIFQARCDTEAATLEQCAKEVEGQFG